MLPVTIKSRGVEVEIIDFVRVKIELKKLKFVKDTSQASAPSFFCINSIHPDYAPNVNVLNDNSFI